MAKEAYSFHEATGDKKPPKWKMVAWICLYVFLGVMCIVGIAVTVGKFVNLII